MQQNNSRQSNQSEIEFNFFGILHILLKSKRFIILTTIAVGAMGMIYSYYFNPSMLPTYEASAVVELGSYPATDETDSYDGRILIASMDASTSLLTALYEKHKPITLHTFRKSEDIIQRVTVHEMDSRYLKIEAVGLSGDAIKGKVNEMIEYINALHSDRLDEAVAKRKREVQNLEEKLLTIEKFLIFLVKDNDVYMSDVAELKLKEIEYTHKLKELNLHISNMDNFRETGIVNEIQFKTNYPESNSIKITFASLALGFILSSLFVFIRHGYINNHKE